MEVSGNRSSSVHHWPPCVCHSGVWTSCRQNLNILHDEEGRELCGLSLVAIWLSISMATSFGSVHPMGTFSWCVILLCAMVPLLGTLLLYVTIDPSILPHHCKGIIQGMQNITRQFVKKN